MDEQEALNIAREALYSLCNQNLEIVVSADMDCSPELLTRACQVLFPDVEIGPNVVTCPNCGESVEYHEASNGDVICDRCGKQFED